MSPRHSNAIKRVASVQQQATKAHMVTHMHRAEAPPLKLPACSLTLQSHKQAAHVPVGPFMQQIRTTLPLPNRLAKRSGLDLFPSWSSSHSMSTRPINSKIASWEIKVKKVLFRGACLHMHLHTGDNNGTSMSKWYSKFMSFFEIEQPTAASLLQFTVVDLHIRKPSLDYSIWPYHSWSSCFSFKPRANPHLFQTLQISGAFGCPLCLFAALEHGHPSNS